jgi:hypothetical protein
MNVMRYVCALAYIEAREDAKSAVLALMPATRVARPIPVHAHTYVADGIQPIHRVSGWQIVVSQ